jgi:four helix bundle protein
VAEGHGRGHRREYVQFLWVSNGSLKETETHLLLAQHIGLAAEADVRPIVEMCDEEGRMLASLIRSLDPDAA